MWLNLAAAHHAKVRLEKENRDKAVKGRDIVAGKMTPAQISEAQRLAHVSSRGRIH
jgi:hypothetical protein